jgi:4-amino-4-deoxychorismate lyase
MLAGTLSTVPERVVAVLGRGVVPADSPILPASDLGVLRGDGIFETIHVRTDGGRPYAWMLSDHLSRMARSAELMELALPSREALLDLVSQALSAWPGGVEGALRLLCTRGPEGGGPVTVFATVAPVGPGAVRARREGIRVLTASLGVPADLRTTAPWLLGGAKTTSYAVPMAAQRWAVAHGADDVLWVSSDGYALEGPTSTLIWLVEDTLWTVPAARTGILAGTTARALLDRAGELGLSAGERMVRPAELADADGAWLTSSVRGVAEIRVLDGVTRKPAALTEELSDLVGYPR